MTLLLDSVWFRGVQELSVVCSLEELAVDLGAKGIFESQQREGDALKHTQPNFIHIFK